MPRAANAQAVTESELDVTTPDGVSDSYFVHPSSGSHPGVLIWPDAFGLRPAKRQMAKRLAESGYAVLVVNQYYRSLRAPIVNTTNFAEVSDTLRPLMGTLNPETQVRDARAFIGFLDRQQAVDSNRKMGTMGYCMGGPFTMRTAASLPDRVGAAASFHGGGLVTDQPDSPPLLVPQMQAQYLFAIAANDDESQPEAKDVYLHTLSLQDAGVFAVEMEVVPKKVASFITKNVDILTISLGSGSGCDGQYLFSQDILGTYQGKYPRHAKVYRKLKNDLQCRNSSILKYFSSRNINFFIWFYLFHKK